MSSKRYDDSKQWYAIHTYSGYEEKVAESIRQRINGVDMADKIFDVIVPKEKQIQIRNGKRKIVEAKIFQGQLQFLKKKLRRLRSEWALKSQSIRLTSQRVKLFQLSTVRSRALMAP